MKANNEFYILFRDSKVTLRHNFRYDLNNGKMINVDTIVDYKTWPFTTTVGDIVNMEVPLVDIIDIHVLKWDVDDNYLGYDYFDYDDGRGHGRSNFTFTYVVPREKDGSLKVRHLAFVFGGGMHTSHYADEIECTLRKGNKITPHYKTLKKKYKKETNQMFFRESLDGNISLFGSDYDIINKKVSLETTLEFIVMKGSYAKSGNIVTKSPYIYSVATFNKSDCKFDHLKKRVDLKLNYKDKYTKVIDAYENTYDIIKLSPVLTPLILLKRCIVQIYQVGDSVITNLVSGTYWETEVEEAINDEEQLQSKYHFAKSVAYDEVIINGIHPSIDGSYTASANSTVWNSTEGHSIYFRKIYNKDEFLGNDCPEHPRYNPNIPRIGILSTGALEGGVRREEMRDDYFGYYEYYATNDTWRIEIYENTNGRGTVMAYSTILWSAPTEGPFTLRLGDYYKMTSSLSGVNDFYLGSNINRYSFWSRILCDVPYFLEPGESYVRYTYDLPADDFASQGRNYKKCIGFVIDKSTQVIDIVISNLTSTEPTPYGMNINKEYFAQPQGSYFPLSRHSWLLNSVWVRLGTGDNTSPFEYMCDKFYRGYEVKDIWHLADIIKVLLREIDPTLKHDKGIEYSEYLYGGVGYSINGGCEIYITQKSNILKGEYDEPAQKAEIKLKDIMDMLRDCFRCYWFIDENNRFRIEHVSYFLNGFTYDSPLVQIDLTKESDKFNKKNMAYYQQEVEYNKDELNSRYEFKWMDNSTKAMGDDLHIDVLNKYVPGGNVAQINVGNFSTDIDYMLSAPEEFSNDGFVLLLADSNHLVPIWRQHIRDEKQNGALIDAYTQNGYASFNNLVQHYRDDISGDILDYNNVEHLYVRKVKRCMKQNVEFIPNDGDEINYKGLITTKLGDGYINELSINIDTNLTEVELRYEPR